MRTALAPEHERGLRSETTNRWGVLALVVAGCYADAEHEAERPQQADAATGMAAGYWMGMAGRFASAPDGRDHPVAVSCHNCYHEDPGVAPQDNLDLSLERIQAATAAGADVIELDVKEQEGVWRVDHEDDGTSHASELADLLTTAAVCDAFQLLFVEIKERSPTHETIRDLLALIRDSRCVEDGRLLVLRAFRGRAPALATAAGVLEEPGFEALAMNVRFHWLYSARAVADEAWSQDIESKALETIDGVEFDYTAPQVRSSLIDARALGLGTGVWTFPASEAARLCRSFRGVVDVVTTDGPPDECKRAIERP